LMRPSTPVRDATADPPVGGVDAVDGEEDDAVEDDELPLEPRGALLMIRSRYVQPA